MRRHLVVVITLTLFIIKYLCKLLFVHVVTYLQHITTLKMIDVQLIKLNNFSLKSFLSQKKFYFEIFFEEILIIQTV